LISVGVTPWVGEPDGFPGWQTSCKSPKLADLAELSAPLVLVVLLVPELELPLRPQAAATSARTSTNANHRNRLTVPPRAKAVVLI